jgi:hypothetical protein
MKILVISYAGIGDTLFATPLIHELRANFPDATIDALVRWRGAKDLLEGQSASQHHPPEETSSDSQNRFAQILLQLRRKVMTCPSTRIRKANGFTGWWQNSSTRRCGSAMNMNVPARWTAG